MPARPSRKDTLTTSTATPQATAIALLQGTPELQAALLQSFTTDAAGTKQAT